jgi:hypothetical protein
MNISKPFASLSPTLLARKGGARPAMRSPLNPIPAFHDATARQLDDLGWNDMGHDEEPAADNDRCVHEAEIVALNPSEPVRPAPLPEIVKRQRGIATLLAPLAPQRQSALAKGRRAAFTLRLDAERHLKLRLACTIGNRSAQQIVIEALDRLIADRPELTELAEKIRPATSAASSPAPKGNRP